MAETVFTGWRTVTPGKCMLCGCSDDWECDGRGNILCNCQRCHECGEHDGHRSTCSYHREPDDEGPTSQPEDPDPRYDTEGGF